MVAASPLLLEAEALAARLPPLLVEAERVAATVALGLHGRRRGGPGDSFWQFRRYQPGDPASGIDWRQSARSDRLYMRETEWLSAQSVWLWVDGSGSMGWRSTQDLPLKRERAMVLGLALSALLLQGGERVGLLGVNEPPVIGRAGLPRLAALLPRQPEGVPVAAPRNGQVILISDFLMPAQELEASLRMLAGRGLRGQLLHIIDPAEETFPFAGRTRFSGLEGEGDMMVAQAEALRPAYEARVKALRAWLADLAVRIGWGLVTHRTDAPPHLPLLALQAALEDG